MEGGKKGWGRIVMIHEERVTNVHTNCIERHRTTFVQRFRKLTTPNRETKEKIEQRNDVVLVNDTAVSIYSGP